MRRQPPEDELIKLAQLLGFLTLIANDLPGALDASATTIRGVVQANANYHRILHERLSKLPEEIGNGVNVEEFSDELAERIRQQLTATGLHQLADFLERLMPDLRTTSANLASLIKPVREQTQQVSRSLDTEIGKLKTAAASVQGTLHQLEAEVQRGTTTSTVLLSLLLLAVGFIAGLVFEHYTTNSVLVDLQNEVQQVQTTVNALKPPAAAAPKRKGEH